LQAAQPRPFGLRRVPPPVPDVAEPENPVLAWVKVQAEIQQNRLQTVARWARSAATVLSAWVYTLASAGVPLSGMAFAGCVGIGKSIFRSIFALALTSAETVARPRRLRLSRPARVAPSNPLLDVMAQSWRGLFVRTLAYVCGIAILSVVAAELFKSAPVVAAVEPETRADWITVGRPFPAFHLNLPDMHEEQHYAIRRHSDGGGRKDILSWGEPGQSPRHFMVEIYRPGGELDGFGAPAAEIEARAANLATGIRMRESLPLDTKFGPVDTVDFNIGDGGHCVGFVRDFDEPRLQISGLSCNSAALVDRAALACAIDRLTLLSAGSDPDIAKLFAQAELKRNFCGQRDPILYATPRRSFEPIKPLTATLRGRFAR